MRADTHMSLRKNQLVGLIFCCALLTVTTAFAVSPVLNVSSGPVIVERQGVKTEVGSGGQMTLQPGDEIYPKDPSQHGVKFTIEGSNIGQVPDGASSKFNGGRKDKYQYKRDDGNTARFVLKHKNCRYPGHRKHGLKLYIDPVPPLLVDTPFVEAWTTEGVYGAFYDEQTEVSEFTCLQGQVELDVDGDVTVLTAGETATYQGPALVSVAPDHDFPAKPTGLVASQNGAGTVSLTWNPVTSDLQGDPIPPAELMYVIHRSSATAPLAKIATAPESCFTDGNDTQVATTTGTQLVDSGLEPGEYYYRVVARREHSDSYLYDSAGSTPASVDVIGSSPVPTPVPGDVQAEPGAERFDNP